MLGNGRELFCNVGEADEDRGECKDSVFTGSEMNSDIAFRCLTSE